MGSLVAAHGAVEAARELVLGQGPDGEAAEAVRDQRAPRLGEEAIDDGAFDCVLADDLWLA